MIVCFLLLSAKQGAFWLACKFDQLDVVQLMMERFCHEELMQGFPSPLYVSCWAKSTSVTEYLLQTLTPSLIQEAGPDGMTPLMILLKKNKGKLITKHFDEFSCDKVLYYSVALKCQTLFEKTIESPNRTVDLETMVEWAIKSNNIETIKYCTDKFGKQSVQHALDLMNLDIPFLNMRDYLRISCTQEESFLTCLTKRYPLFNENTEEKFQFRKLKDASKVSVKEDILIHVKDLFCPLVSAGPKHSFRISELGLRDDFSCPEGLHGG